MKNHLKRIASPRTWSIKRKENVFITRPNPGAHSFEMGLSLNVIIRDMLELASTTSEVKKLLNNNEVLVDGKRRYDHHFIVGLFDVLSIPSANKYYRICFDKKGRLTVIEIDQKESMIKPCKIVGKTMLSKKRIQYNLYDGKNIIADVDAKVGDTLVLSLPNLEVKEVLGLKENASVFLLKGKHIGVVATFKEIKEDKAIFVVDDKEIKTTKNYLFVLGEKKPIIKINNQ